MIRACLYTGFGRNRHMRHGGSSAIEFPLWTLCIMLLMALMIQFCQLGLASKNNLISLHYRLDQALEGIVCLEKMATGDPLKSHSGVVSSYKQGVFLVFGKQFYRPVKEVAFVKEDICR